MATAAPKATNAQAQQVMWGVNVLGTENVIQACMDEYVEKLVFVSTFSVHFDGRDLVDISEDHPYATRALDQYTGTKIKGEKLVLAAGKRVGSKLATVALRPSYIYGEGDPLFLPSIAQRGVEGKMRYTIGDGKNMVEITYVGNVAHGVILAAEKLQLKGSLDGKAVFITDQDPQPFWGFCGELLRGLGYPERLLPHNAVPVWLMLLIATFIEFILAPILLRFNPKARVDLSRFRVLTLSCTRTCTYTMAQDVLGYKPRWTHQMAVKRTLDGFPHLRYNATKPSGTKSD